jgi:hypothetical protein
MDLVEHSGRSEADPQDWQQILQHHGALEVHSIQTTAEYVTLAGFFSRRGLEVTRSPRTLSMYVTRSYGSVDVAQATRVHKDSIRVSGVHDDDEQPDARATTETSWPKPLGP